MIDYGKMRLNYTGSAQGSRMLSVLTPFCPDGSLPAADEEVQGMLQGDSCRLLLKALWLACLARPDIAKAIND
eukprot:10848500-Karenia_brevis.AAC.1